MNPRLQGDLLEELFRLISEKSQLWIATHAIGMMRKALQLYERHGEKVVFLDFDDNRDNRDFDSQEVVIIEPEKPDREFWERTHEVALDDLAALIAPDQIVICEGKQGIEASTQNATIESFLKNFPIQNSFQRAEREIYKITSQLLVPLRKVQRFSGSEIWIKPRVGRSVTRNKRE